jgi:uncharacterized protein YbbK (DUF523 family)
MNILISACLIGVNCRYNAERFVMDGLDELMAKHHLIPVCPEIFGGMSTPRDPSEIRSGRVYAKSGADVTDYYKRGADEVLRLARLYKCEYAVLKQRSPSCGHGRIYDGTFSGQLIEGSGVCAKRLAEAGITVLDETEISKLMDL